IITSRAGGASATPKTPGWLRALYANGHAAIPAGPGAPANGAAQSAGALAATAVGACANTRAVVATAQPAAAIAQTIAHDPGESWPRRRAALLALYRTLHSATAPRCARAPVARPPAC